MKHKWIKSETKPTMWVLSKKTPFISFVVKTRNYLGNYGFIAYCGITATFKQFIYLTDAKKWIIAEINKYEEDLERWWK